MSRLAAKFEQLAQRGRKALVPYVTAGDPEPNFTLPLLHAMVAAGADIIELGAPFSDPAADGPVIQRAHERALMHKMSLRRTLQVVSEFRRTNTTTPIVIMGYLNPIEAMGYSQFAEAAAQAGVDGVLTVDLPPEEAQECAALLKAKHIDPIFLLAPNSNSERIQAMASIGSGYLYYVSLKGVTGAGHLDTEQVALKLKQIRALTTMPVLIGFGIKTPETAKIIANLGEGVVIGSAFISKIAEHLNDMAQAQHEIAALLADMRQAMDKA